ncbi:hypothetical protein BYT27DRAFT_7261243 [Phlegmacium glaucopus]|nr:hypothetical protein BYT27DRAFT_7261243 [Phlegmacium glaucopus]
MPHHPRKTTYTKTLSALRKTELIHLADDLGLDSEGSVAELRTRLKDHLNENRDDLFQNPRYNGLYPRHCHHNQPPPPLPQPGSDTLSTQSSQSTAYSHLSWEGITDNPHHHSPPPSHIHANHRLSALTISHKGIHPFHKRKLLTVSRTNTDW